MTERAQRLKKYLLNQTVEEKTTRVPGNRVFLNAQITVLLDRRGEKK